MSPAKSWTPPTAAAKRLEAKLTRGSGSLVCRGSLEMPWGRAEGAVGWAVPTVPALWSVSNKFRISDSDPDPLDT